MQRKFLIIAATLAAVALSAPAFAQQSLPQGLGGEGAFHQFLASHPRVRADLVRNPNLVNDPNYVRAHPQFNAFYSKHPEVRSELAENAPEFMRREEWGFKHPGQYNRANANSMHEAREESIDSYFDGHPQVQRELAQHPGLVNDPKYMKNHPGLAQFERSHPAIAQQFRSHPRKFMNNEENYQRQENH